MERGHRARRAWSSAADYPGLCTAATFDGMTLSGQPCPACGAPTDPSAQFCFECGAALLRCHACFASVPADAKFCPQCGTPQKLSSAQRVDDESAASEARIAVESALKEGAKQAKLRSGGGNILANVLLFSGLLAVILVVIKEMNEGKTKEVSPFEAPPPSSKVEAPGPSVRGVVRLSAPPPSGAVLFVIARPRGIERGPPLAVKRVATPSFPQAFQLTAQDVMQPGRAFEGPLSITARLDQDGNAMSKSPGDWVSKPVLADVGGAPVKVVLDERL